MIVHNKNNASNILISLHLDSFNGLTQEIFKKKRIRFFRRTHYSINLIFRECENKTHFEVVLVMLQIALNPLWCPSVVTIVFGGNSEFVNIDKFASSTLNFKKNQRILNERPYAVFFNSFWLNLIEFLDAVAQVFRNDLPNCHLWYITILFKICK